MPATRQVLSWIYLGRMALAGTFFGTVVGVWTDAPARSTLAATLTLLACLGFTVPSFIHTHVRRRAAPREFLYAQVLFDVALVTWVVYLTGAQESIFSPLYVLVICAAAILLPILGGILIGVLASILYFATIVWTAHSPPGASVALQIALFTAVALVTGYLGDRLRRTGAVLGAVETELRLLQLETDEILDSIGTGVLTVDGGGRLAYLNQAGAELLGLEAEAWRGKPVLDALDAAAPGLGAVLARTTRRRAGVSRFETGATPDGLVLGVSTTLMATRAPLQAPVTAIFQDITDRKRADALRSRAERLEAVAELSASLAHEIKNPLASIRSAVEQLADGRLDGEDRDVLRALVVRESDRLSRLLTDFIDFARAKVRSPAPVDMMLVARNVVDLVRAHPAASAREVRLRITPPEDGLFVAGDEDLLHRAVLNLVLNAAQWAGPGGVVEVTLDVGAPDAARVPAEVEQVVRLRVSDTGPGVAAEVVDRIFDPFFTQRADGTGLGLALVHRAAEAHRGAVLVEPRAPGSGAVFALYLPVLPAAELEPAGAEPVPAIP